MKKTILCLLVLTYINVSAQVQEGLDGVYVYKPFEINNLSDSRVTKFIGEPEEFNEVYIISFGKLKELKDLTIKIKIDFKNVDQRADYNFVIVFLYNYSIVFSADTIFSGIYYKELIAFSKTRELSCFDVFKGVYSLGEYEIDIILKPINSTSGNVIISINEEIIAQKNLNFSDIKESNDWGIMISKLKSAQNIKSFYLRTEKEEFVKREKGEIFKIESEYSTTGSEGLLNDTRDGKTYKIVKIGSQLSISE